jgi:hypothetical protein
MITTFPADPVTAKKTALADNFATTKFADIDVTEAVPAYFLEAIADLLEEPANSNIDDQFVDGDPNLTEQLFAASGEEIVDADFDDGESESLTASQIELEEDYIENGAEIAGTEVIPYRRKPGKREKTGAKFRAYWIKPRRRRAYIMWRAFRSRTKPRTTPRPARKPRPR